MAGHKTLWQLNGREAGSLSPNLLALRVAGVSLPPASSRRRPLAESLAFGIVLAEKVRHQRRAQPVWRVKIAPNLLDCRDRGNGWRRLDQSRLRFQKLQVCSAGNGFNGGRAGSGAGPGG